MFGDDGSLYREELSEVSGFEFTTKTDIEFVVNNEITQKIKDIKVRNFFLKNFDRNNTISELNYTFIMH